MGCCQSTNSEASSRHDLSSLGPNGRSGANADAQLAPSQPQYHGSPDNNRPADNPNQRIRAPSPVLRSPRNVSQMQPPWTPAHLARQREIFFETRVAGRAEVWGAIRTAAELLVRGAVVDAQGILDAACITCPTGRVAKGRGRDRVRGGLYDERGRLYEVPDWVVRDPEDLREDQEDGEELTVFGEKEEGVEEDEGDDSLGQRGEKGKGRAIGDSSSEVSGQAQRVRVRFSNGAPDVEISLLSTQTVATLHRLLQDRVVEPGAKVRIVYLGKLLVPGKTLAAQGWKSGDVLSALVATES